MNYEAQRNPGSPHIAKLPNYTDISKLFIAPRSELFAVYRSNLAHSIAFGGTIALNVKIL